MCRKRAQKHCYKTYFLKNFCEKVCRNENKGVTLHSLSGTEVPPVRRRAKSVEEKNFKKIFEKFARLKISS